MQELTGLNSKWASTLMSQHLLAAADRYGLDRLRLLCEASLCEDVAINTVATTLALAEQHHCFQLKAVCLKFVAMPENLRGESLFVLIFTSMLHQAFLWYKYYFSRKNVIVMLSIIWTNPQGSLFLKLEIVEIKDCPVQATNW